MVSVIIPSYKDPLLHKTIDNLLENATGEVEIIVVLDAYWPVTPIKDDPRIVQVHLGKNVGMRRAINAGCAIAKGEFLLRVDEHCTFAKGWDTTLSETCEDNWIVSPTRYFLDPVKWELMDIPPVNFCKLVIRGNGDQRKFSAEVWKERDEELKDVMIAETMGMQGSVWFMPTKWWRTVIGELQNEGYGPLYQDSTEMIMKTWQAGGKMMLNKNTWHSHKHRDFPRTHNNGTKENPSNNEACFAYSLSIWEKYYTEVIKPKWGI